MGVYVDYMYDCKFMFFNGYDVVMNVLLLFLGIKYVRESYSFSKYFSFVFVLNFLLFLIDVLVCLWVVGEYM